MAEYLNVTRRHGMSRMRRAFSDDLSTTQLITLNKISLESVSAVNLIFFT
jgi:hypothetical protein